MASQPSQGKDNVVDEPLRLLNKQAYIIDTTISQETQTVIPRENKNLPTRLIIIKWTPPT